MRTAKIFQHGSSQAVRLPKEFRFSDVEVVVKHYAGGVLLLPRKYEFETLKTIADAFKGEIPRAGGEAPQQREF